MSEEQVLLEPAKTAPYGEKVKFMVNELVRILSDGPVPVSVIKAYFTSLGYKESTLYLAYSKLNIESKPDGKRSTLWALPPEQEPRVIEKEIIKEVMIQPTREERRQILRQNKPKEKKIDHLANAERELKEVKKALADMGRAITRMATTS